MEAMALNTRRKSTLFLVEQLIVIAVFALCAIACISILTTSYFMARDSRDTANALIEAQNCAEAFKAFGGNTVFGTVVYYDKNWQKTDTENDAEFVLVLDGDVQLQTDGSAFYDGKVSVDKITGKSLVILPVAIMG